MSRPKYTYAVEAERTEGGDWAEIVQSETRDFCVGYVCSHQSQPGTKLALRMIRSDGRIGDESARNIDVSLGMIAGFPTPDQYRDAADRALVRAMQVEQATARREGRNK